MSGEPALVTPGLSGIRASVAALRRGDLVVIPTDTVYGLAALPVAAAVARLYPAKGRAEDRAIPVLVSDASAVLDLAQEWPPVAEALAAAFWPGALTIVVKALPSLPKEITAGRGTVGIRMPACPLATAVIRLSGGALAVTSANRSGEPPATSAHEAAAGLGRAVAVILDGGGSAGGRPSTVVAVKNGGLTVLREGAVPRFSLRTVLVRAGLSLESRALEENRCE